jgi:chromosome segregation ATPase
MSPSNASRRSAARENGNHSNGRHARVDSVMSSEIPPTNEYQNSPIPMSSATLSHENITSFQNEVNPHVTEFFELKDDLIKRFSTMGDVVEKIFSTFEEHRNVVRGVGESWGKEQEQSREIKELKAKNVKLLLWPEEKGKQYEDQIEDLQKKLYAARRAAEVVEQQYADKYADRENDLIAREKRSQLDYEKKIRDLRTKEIETEESLKEKNAKEIEDLNRTISRLNKTNAKANDETKKLKANLETLEVELEDMKLEYEKSERAYKGLLKEHRTVQSDMEKMKKEVDVPERSDEYLLDLYLQALVNNSFANSSFQYSET